MEIKVKDNNINFTIEKEKINGIAGSHLEDIVEILKLNTNRKIIIDNNEIEDKYEYKRQIEVVEEFFKVSNNYSSPRELLFNEISNNKIYPKDINKKINDAIRIVGLDEEILDRSLYQISSSEAKLLQIGISLLTNPDLIILVNPFKGIDGNNTKRIIILLRKLITKYHKTFVITSEDQELLYQYTDHLVIYINYRILKEGNTKQVYKRVDFLKKHKVNVPEIVEFTYLARKLKNVKIDYFDDIRDIIKDIYKHV